MSVFEQLRISESRAKELALELFGIKGEAKKLDGEVDFNYRISSTKGDYILKVSRPNEDQEFIDFQQQLLQRVKEQIPTISTQEVILDLNQNRIAYFKDERGDKRMVRMLTWIDGRLWSSVNPQTDDMRYQLGVLAGKITQALQGFDHPKAHRTYDWDLAQGKWLEEHMDRFEGTEAELLRHFQLIFREQFDLYSSLRKSVVHQDVNDNNIVVSSDLRKPEVQAVIDYGDAVHTHTINDLAVASAYAIMHQPDPLSAILPLIKGYHSSFPVTDEELQCLYSLVSVRLMTTVTKSSIGRELEPDNEYLRISEQPAWNALNAWRGISPQLAYYRFREACGLSPHPQGESFNDWAATQQLPVQSLFPDLDQTAFCPVDMSVSSKWLGNRAEYENDEITRFKLKQLVLNHPNAVVAGGYGEVRPFYTTEAYRQEGNNGFEYRNTHLGVDFWLEEETKIATPFDAEVIAVHDNGQNKDYGPTIILKHTFDNHPFYILYGHLSTESLHKVKVGENISKGTVIGTIGAPHANGGWTPHLHFQIMLDLLENTADFPGTCVFNQSNTWQSICPNPFVLFDHGKQSNRYSNEEEIIAFRKEHLGKSLSLSYDKPLHIVRGEGPYLIDITGRKYLDTVNNVAHVGHEHPRVVAAGQRQMGLLNTNTRYLSKEITDFAEALLAQFPPELCVVHFVNSGSEANELALRMAKTVTGQKDMIAIEVGYHGNTNSCIDISSYKFDGRGGKGAPEHTQIVPLPDTFRGLYQGNGAGEKFAAHVNEQIKRIHEKGRGLAGFIAEPIISCGGQIELPENYLKIAYDAVRTAGGVCISDEVQVGFGRVGKAFWGFELHGVIPDIVSMGKPIGNGHPLAAVVCTKEVAEKFANGMEYFNTFGGNPVSSAIGKEVLSIIHDERLQENALEVGKYLNSELKNLQQRFPIIGDVRGQGLFLGFELTSSNKEPLPEQAAYLANRMRELGILMSTDGPQHNVLKIKPPIVFGKEHADEFIRRLEMVFSEDFMLSFE